MVKLRAYNGDAIPNKKFRDGISYFTPSKNYSYIKNSPYVTDAELTFNNPYHTENQSMIERLRSHPDWISDLKNEGYDGVIYSAKNDYTKGATGWGNDYPQYLVFSNSQIKIIEQYANPHLMQESINYEQKGVSIMDKFLNFLESLRTDENSLLLESIAKGYVVINENALYSDGTGRWHSEYQDKLRAKKEDGSYVYDNESLRYIIDDCKAALDAMPDNPKAGQYEDEIHYCAAELRRRQASRQKFN